MLELFLSSSLHYFFLVFSVVPLVVSVAAPVPAVVVVVQPT